jgi:hypothetical protein
MATTVIGGNVKEGSIITAPFGSDPVLVIPTGVFSSESYPLKGNIEQIEIVTEENKKKFTGSVGWGIVGGLALGPIGALAGVLSGGRSKETLLACTLKDGRMFIAKTTDSKMVAKLLALQY